MIRQESLDLSVPDSHSNLILARKPGESILIGQGEGAVLITVGASRGSRTTISIRAPRTLPVVRTEVLDR